MDSRADEIIKRHGRMKASRSILDAHCQEIAERVWPDRATFITKRPLSTGGGEKRTEKMFDTTAPLALTRFAAAMESMLTPRTAKWHRLRVSDEELNERPEVQRYLDEVTNILFRVRYSPRANFASQQHESYLSLGAFGTGGMMIEDVLGQGVRYKALDFANTYFEENAHGVVDYAHRELEFTARQAAQKFGEKNLPEKVRAKLEHYPETPFTFVHCVRPNEDMKRGRKDFQGMPYSSFYVCLDTRDIVDEGGYTTFPLAFGRYITAPGEVYGRSPAMLALPGVKMLNEMKKTILRGAHRAVSPPYLLQDDGALRGFDLRPDALNPGMLDDRGQPRAVQMEYKGNHGLGMDLIQDEQRIINDIFLVTLFQILVDAPQMTATEAMLRAQEKGALLAPTMGRQQSENLGTLIERELDILARAGVLPEMPDELIEAGGSVEVEYLSPLNRAQRAEDGVAILRTFESIAPLAQLDPKVLQAFDTMKAVRELAEINGMPAKILRSDEEIAQAQQEEQAQMQAAQLLQAAPIVADTAKTLAETSQIASQGIPAITPGG